MGLLPGKLPSQEPLDWEPSCPAVLRANRPLPWASGPQTESLYLSWEPLNGDSRNPLPSAPVAHGCPCGGDPFPGTRGSSGRKLRGEPVEPWAFPLA